MGISTMSVGNQRLCAWSAVAFLVVWIPSYWALARFVPPPAPDMSSAELARIFQDNTNGIKLGLLMSMAASALLGPFAAVITVQMRRIEGPHSPLAYSQLVLGALIIPLFIFPMMFLEAAAFRPDRNPDEIRILSDMAWMGFIGAWFTVVFQWLSIGIAILRDDRPEPVFPRWAGYVNLAVAIGSLPGSLIYFFKSGPAAWNGVLCFWIPATAFVIWLVVMTIVLRAAINQQARELA
jgi:hypothetical protein